MSIFSTDSKLYKAIQWFGNIVVLNLCWLLFSIPIVTIGASTVAAFSIALKMIDGTEGYMFKGFVKEFGKNWKQGTILWVITVIAIYALYLDAQILGKTNDPSIPLIVVSIVSFLFIFFALLFAYPLSARYENKWYLHLKNSFLLSIRFFKKTMFLLLILVLEVGLFFWNNKTLFLLIAIGPMIFIYTVAGTSRKIFADIDKKNEEEVKMAAAVEAGKRDAEKMETLAKENDTAIEASKKSTNDKK